MSTTVTDAVFAAGREPSAPLLTFYDDSSGERTELSGLTVANWAAKTANWLRDEAGVAPGDEVVVDLPAHWQTFVILLGAWWSGAHVVLGPSTSASAVFCAADRLDAHAADEVLAVPLDPFAGPVPGLPPGVSGFGDAVRVHGDRFGPIVAGSLALEGRSTDDVVRHARSAAADLGVTDGDRVLSTRPWGTPDSVISGVIGPVVTGASLVQVAHADPARLAARIDSERVTSTLR